MAIASSLLVVLTLAVAIATPDWTDCPTPCRCKWTSGKKTALCRDASFTVLPTALDADMQVLDLSGNSIPRLGRDAFRAAGLMNLQRLFMKNARLRQVHRDAFRDLIILIEVDLSYNEIVTLEPDTFHGNERLRVLSLTGNPLTVLVRAQFPLLPHLRSLELEACQLVNVHRDAFVHLTALESLNLKGNQLGNLSAAAFMNFAHLKSLTLDENPWLCDCNLRGFRDWFLASNLRSTSLVCAEPETLANRAWEDVTPEEFACAPHVRLSTHPQVQAEAGGNVTFGCHVQGDPEPEVTWLYENRPINHTWLVVESEEGLLDKWVNISVYNVSDADAGLYSCIARNSLALVAQNVSLVLPEVVTATTLSKSEPGRVWWWASVCTAVVVLCSIVCVGVAVCCLRVASSRDGGRSHRRRGNMKTSISFNDQEKKLLDVSIATTTDRGTGSTEAIGVSTGPDNMELLEQPPVHITIESDPLASSLGGLGSMFPPPPAEFSTSALPAGAFGNIFISVSVSRDASTQDPAGRCPDLLDLPHRTSTTTAGLGGAAAAAVAAGTTSILKHHHHLHHQPLQPPPLPSVVYHGMATLPRRPCTVTAPQYDNMGPRVTAAGSSTWSLPDDTAAGMSLMTAPTMVTMPNHTMVMVMPPNMSNTASMMSPPPLSCPLPLHPEFVSL